MKMQKLITMSALTASALVVAACGSVEGSYKLDRAEMKKTMEADIAKLPEDQQAMAKTAFGLIDLMDINLELSSGGKAEMKMSMAGHEDKAKEKNQTWEWKKDGKKVVIKSGDGKEISCDAEGGKLTCEGGAAGGMTKLVFVKS
jgi:outer membrane murein-binding lipoprotein Lpp